MLKIRRATTDDAEDIARVHVESWKETYRGIVPDEILNTLSIPRRAGLWGQSLADPQDEYHLAFVAELDGRIIGFANYGREREADPVYHGELFAIYVLQAAHGLGLGRELVTAAARDLLERDISSMLVWVLEQNPARGFYEHLGGEYIREKPIQIGSAALREVAYGWKDLRMHVPEGGLPRHRPPGKV